MTNEQKRENAMIRKKERLVAEKKKADEDKSKRDLVRARKHYLGHKISDIMSFVNNSESLWDFIGIEKNW